MDVLNSDKVAFTFQIQDFLIFQIFQIGVPNIGAQLAKSSKRFSGIIKNCYSCLVTI